MVSLLNDVCQGRLEFFRSTAVGNPNSEFLEEPNRYIYTSGVPFVTCNGVIEKDAANPPSEKEIEHIVEYFKAKKLPFMWWSENKALESKGLRFAGNLKGIARSLSGRVTADVVPGLTIIQAESKADLALFANIMIVTFCMDPRAKESLVNYLEASFKNGEEVHYLAFMDGKAVSCLTLSTCANSAGIWNAGTLSGYRKKGILTALVNQAIVEAQSRNYKQIMAILMPKGMAWGVFQKFGFEEVCNFPFFVYGAVDLEK